MARLAQSQDPVYGGENWDGSADGLLSSFEASQERYRPTGTGTAADVDACPAREAMRPSFYAVDPLSLALNPRTVTVGGLQRGYSGRLQGDLGADGNSYVLKAGSGVARQRGIQADPGIGLMPSQRVLGLWPSDDRGRDERRPAGGSGRRRPWSAGDQQGQDG